MTLYERLRVIFYGLVLGFAVTFLALNAHAASCPEQGDQSKPMVTEWGGKCGKATGSCAEPYRCLWPPDCRCDFQPLGMTRDPQADGWDKKAAKK